MNYPPKLVPPLNLGLRILWMFLIPSLVSTLPTVQHNLRGNLIQNLDKAFFQPPALEETIHEVQMILNQDPSLPRLTRGEIEELYEKVTREEYEKSMKAGDKARADSMRALMLVLPYNTDNNTEENLQELFTRPPVTKVVDSYTSHLPIQFLTPSLNNEAKTETKGVGQMAVTTYKPLYQLKTKPLPPNPTTYHPPNPPPVLYRMTPSMAQAHLHHTQDNFLPFKPLITEIPLNYDYNLERTQSVKPVQRFSSHYNANNPEFQKMTSTRKKTSTTSTIKPVADVLESLGIVAGHTQTRSRVGLEDFYAAESAPQPQVISVADLKGLRSQSLGPQIKADAYSMFKPLNIGEEIRVKPEVEGYLTRFGIVGGRKRKAIKKNEASSTTQNSLEQLSQESEIATAKVPSSHVKAKKGVNANLGNSELEKLLENLRELERLNANTKTVQTTEKPIIITTTTTSTTTTTPAPTTAASSLITNGEPMLIQPKKPRRRIDPNIDINFANQGNQQTETNHEDQLSKLLENLQELEKLKINPENVVKSAVPLNKGSNTAASRPIAVVTPAPKQAAALTNRFTMANLTPQQQLLLFQQQSQTGASPPDLDQLQKVLQQLQVYEKANAKTSTTTTTTTSTTKKPEQIDQLAPADLWQLRKLLTENTTTKKPIPAQIGPADFSQLRKLLTDDSELEKLFEQAKARQQQQNQKSKPKTTSTTTTTKKPGPSVSDIIELQKYLAELEKSTSRATTSTTTTSTTTTTTTTTPKPPMIPTYPTIEYESRPKKQTVVDHGDLQALINRVQQLERINIQQREKELEKPLATDTPLSSLLGFTTRNIKATSPRTQDLRLPINDFANLRTLYQQVDEAEKATNSDIEISTKATAAKAYQEQLYETATRKSQNFAQRIIDITNDTGSGSSLPEVDSNDFVQLQKLLSKVQELERVRINVPTANPRAKFEKEATKAPNLDTAASQRNHNVQNLNGAHIVYPSKETTYKEVEDLLLKDTDTDDLRLDLPAYKQTIEKPLAAISKPKEQTSSEELKELVYSKPAPAENDAYKNLQPPMIFKTVTKETPRFVATKKPKEIKLQTAQENMNDLEELQKLLNNAQELKKLGVSLPKELTQQLETKFTAPQEDGYTSFKKLPQTDQKTQKKEAAGIEEYLQRFGLSQNEAVVTTTTFSPTTASSEEEEGFSEKTAVFSLTTMKSLIPKSPKTTTESSVELPIFSATKIIEAAIKRAANKIGVSTEHPQGPQGFRRRTDDNIEETEDEMEVGVLQDQDLMTDFSEFNYQLALPDEKTKMPSNNEEEDLEGDFSEMNYQIASPVYRPETEEKKQTTVPDLTENVDELQRLIKNLQELKNLNLTPDDKSLLRQADIKYLENLKKQQTPADDTIKTRRQSATPSEATSINTESTTTTSTPSTTTAAPVTTTTITSTDDNRIQLNLNLDDGDTDDGESSNVSTTTAATTSTSTTTEESRNGSLADLEDSFGPDPNTESPPPPKKKNGFYFLADWNSFLEVGDGDDQVVVRLSPKIGDPRLFIPVKIP